MLCPQQASRLVEHLEGFFRVQSEAASKKKKPLIPAHLVSQNGWPVLDLLRRCVLLSQNGAARHVFFLSTRLDATDLLCQSSKPNSIPTAQMVTQATFFRGLYLLPDFICEQTEKKLLAEFDKHEFETLKNRKVQHYGYNFNYTENSVDKGHAGLGHAVPGLFHSVLVRDNNYFGQPGVYMDKVRPMFMQPIPNSFDESAFKGLSGGQHEAEDSSEHGQVGTQAETQGKESTSTPAPTPGEEADERTIFNQFTVNLYTPGNGIPPHVDSHLPFLEPVVSLSLLSPVVITFRNLTENSVKHFVLPARCLLLMTGEARFSWSHCIAGRKMDRVESGGVFFRDLRISLTCRVIKQVFKCECQYPLGCDDADNPNKKASPS